MMRAGYGTLETEEDEYEPPAFQWPSHEKPQYQSQLDEQKRAIENFLPRAIPASNNLLPQRYPAPPKQNSRYLGNRYLSQQPLGNNLCQFYPRRQSFNPNASEDDFLRYPPDPYNSPDGHYQGRLFLKPVNFYPFNVNDPGKRLPYYANQGPYQTHKRLPQTKPKSYTSKLRSHNVANRRISRTMPNDQGLLTTHTNQNNDPIIPRDKYLITRYSKLQSIPQQSFGHQKTGIINEFGFERHNHSNPPYYINYIDTQRPPYAPPPNLHKSKQSLWHRFVLCLKRKPKKFLPEERKINERRQSNTSNTPSINYSTDKSLDSISDVTNYISGDNKSITENSQLDNRYIDYVTPYIDIMDKKPTKIVRSPPFFPQDVANQNPLFAGQTNANFEVQDRLSDNDADKQIINKDLYFDPRYQKGQLDLQQIRRQQEDSQSIQSENLNVNDGRLLTNIDRNTTKQTNGSEPPVNEKKTEHEIRIISHESEPNTQTDQFVSNNWHDVANNFEPTDPRSRTQQVNKHNASSGPEYSTRVQLLNQEWVTVADNQTRNSSRTTQQNGNQPGASKNSSGSSLIQEQEKRNHSDPATHTPTTLGYRTSEDQKKKSKNEADTVVQDFFN